MTACVCLLAKFSYELWGDLTKSCKNVVNGLRTSPLKAGDVLDSRGLLKIKAHSL